GAEEGEQGGRGGGGRVFQNRHGVLASTFRHLSIQAPGSPATASFAILGDTSSIDLNSGLHGRWMVTVKLEAPSMNPITLFVTILLAAIGALVARSMSPVIAAPFLLAAIVVAAS